MDTKLHSHREYVIGRARLFAGSKTDAEIKAALIALGNSGINEDSSQQDVYAAALGRCQGYMAEMISLLGDQE